LMLKGAPRIVFIIILKHYIANPTSLFAILKSILWYIIKVLLYRTDSYKRTDTTSLDYYCAKKLETYEEGTTYGVPYYIEKTDKQFRVNYVPFVHKKIFGNIRAEVSLEYANNGGNTKFWSYNNGYRVYTPSELFPCINYKKLESMMKT